MVRGLLVESDGPQATVGEVCRIELEGGEHNVWAEVVGVRGHTVQLMAYGDMSGVEAGAPVIASGRRLSVQVSDKLLGRVIDGFGRPIDDKGEISSPVLYPVVREGPSALDRPPIREQLVTGVRAIDSLVAVGKGQRLGIFSGSGVGKSTLISMVARNTRADVNVIALIGERGREVGEFIRDDLGPEGLKRSVVVVSTSHAMPLARLRGGFVATTIAEYFRDQGADVMLLFDSITRFARAQREIALSTGDPPATRGFPPSVFSMLPRLLERAGTTTRGSITGFYSVLVEGDDMDEPISDTVRGILDGHLVLSRRLAERYHYPAIDVLASLSRLARRVRTPKQAEAAGRLRSLLADYARNEDLINAGVYTRGTSPDVDRAIDAMPQLNAFLRQSVDEPATIEDTNARLFDVAGMQHDEGDQVTARVDRRADVDDVPPTSWADADTDTDTADGDLMNA